MSVLKTVRPLWRCEEGDEALAKQGEFSTFSARSHTHTHTHTLTFLERSSSTSRLPVGLKEIGKKGEKKKTKEEKETRRKFLVRKSCRLMMVGRNSYFLVE